MLGTKLLYNRRLIKTFPVDTKSISSRKLGSQKSLVHLPTQNEGITI